MNCEKCQKLLSDFLDGELSDEDRMTLDAHLEECLSCSSVREELDSIVTFCRDHRGEYDAPPNERAMWHRIRNTIESQRGVRGLAAAGSSATGQTLNWLSRLFGRQWKLSFTQMAAAVVAITIVVSLATVVGMRRFQSNRSDELTGTSEINRTGSPGRSALTSGNIDERLKPQQQLVDYWNKRIDQRQAMWSTQTREAFERNLKVIDQAVYAFREELQRNPQDQVSAEMLEAAMSDKVDLLSGFAEL